MSTLARQTSSAQPVRFADLLAPPSSNHAMGATGTGTDATQGATSSVVSEPSTEDSETEPLETPAGISPPQPAGRRASHSEPIGAGSADSTDFQGSHLNIPTGMPTKVDGGVVLPVEGAGIGDYPEIPRATPSMQTVPPLRVPKVRTELSTDGSSTAEAAAAGRPTDTSHGARPSNFSPGGPFAPLQAELPEPGQLETLAPTTPSDEAPTLTPLDGTSNPDEDTDEEAAARIDEEDTATLPPDGAPAADKSPQRLPPAEPPRESHSDELAPVVTYSPFGLQGLRKAFPMSGPDNEAAQLLSEKQAVDQLQTLGLPPKDAKPGMHLLRDGGAIVVHQERAYRVNHLDPTCVHALRTAPKALLSNFIDAAEAIQKSQEIARLTSVSKSAAAIANSAIVACPGAKVLRERLAFLQRSCDEWASARNKVAKLMHQRKARADQIESLKKQLSTMTDVLAKDTEAVASATKAEKRMASMKQKLVLALSVETSGEVTSLASLQKSVARNS